MNSYTGIGRLGRDVELKVLPSGKSVASFSIAVDSRTKDKDGKPKTLWLNVTAWEKLGEICAQFLKKGSKIYVGGEPELRTYKAKDGSEKTSLDLNLREMEMLDAKGAAKPAADSDDDEEETEDIPF